MNFQHKRNATAIDHIITNLYLASDLKIVIIKNRSICIVSDTPDISTYRLTSTFKRYINNKSVKQFNLLLNEVKCYTILQTKFPNKTYESFFETFLCLYTKAFSKGKLNRSVLSSWMAKALQKS